MTQFVYDRTAGIPAVIEEVLPSEASMYYVREPNGALIARISGSSLSYYHFDALGSTRLLTDSLGTVTDTYTYDAWGNVAPGGSNVTSQPYQFVGQLGYYTHYQDENMNLLQLGVRFYSPTIGRFTQRDRIVRSAFSAFAYCDNDPQMLSDPKGLAPKEWKCSVRKPPKPCRKWPVRAAAIRFWCHACLHECYEMCDKTYIIGQYRWTRCQERCGKDEQDGGVGAYANCLLSDFEYSIVLPGPPEVK